MMGRAEVVMGIGEVMMGRVRCDDENSGRW